MIGFTYLENRDTEIHIIHTALDDYIPFCEYFVIPYLLWFGFVAVTVIYFALSNERKTEFYQLSKTLCMGMTIFLIVSFVYPNGQNLRPKLVGDGICIQLVNMLYKIDTPTNILPSLHVSNAVACCVALLKNKKIKEKRGVTVITVVLTVMIILSTMFLKQHSVVDVVLALIMNVLCYQLVYVIPVHNQLKNKKEGVYLHKRIKYIKIRLSRKE